MCGRAKKVREERHAGATAKRRKMTEELEKRERAFQAERSEEQSARSRLHVSLTVSAMPGTLHAIMPSVPSSSRRGSKWV